MKRLITLLLLMPVLLFAQVDEDEAPETQSTFFAALDSTSQESQPEIPLLLSWTKTPSAQMKAQVRKINFNAKLDNSFVFKGQNILSVSTEFSQDDYRRQDKVVENRKGNLSFSNQDIAGFKTNFGMMDNWSEDTIVNSGGIKNVNKSDLKQANIGISKDSYQTGDV
ncbi:MAG: hypothetical protein GY893_13620, partial [bacterium]|nr:hypothetical protein [bacterium]